MFHIHGVNGARWSTNYGRMKGSRTHKPFLYYLRAPGCQMLKASKDRQLCSWLHPCFALPPCLTFPLLGLHHLSSPRMSAKIDHRDELEYVADDKCLEGTSTCSQKAISEAGGHGEVPYTTTNEDDWETDPDNARNWSARRKWTATTVVGDLSFTASIPNLHESDFTIYVLDPLCKYTNGTWSASPHEKVSHQ